LTLTIQYAKIKFIKYNNKQEENYDIPL